MLRLIIYHKNLLYNFRFDSRNIGGFIFSDQFIQLSALLPSKYIYGLGEHRTNLVLDSNWKTYTMFNHDSTPKPDVSIYNYIGIGYYTIFFLLYNVLYIDIMFFLI